MSRADDASQGRTLSALRDHLMATSAVATACFATVLAVGAFAPLAAQLGRADLGSEHIVGYAEHFLFLHSALWPLTLLSLVSCIAAASVLYLRMRAPLVRFVRCFEAIREGRPTETLRIRAYDYLRDEADALNRMIRGLDQREAERRAWRERLAAVVDDLEAAGNDAESLAELRSLVKSEPGTQGASERREAAKD